jgi:hypothetical protein
LVISWEFGEIEILFISSWGEKSWKCLLHEKIFLIWSENEEESLNVELGWFKKTELISWEWSGVE